MNILGVQFDSRLQWTEHISNTINKSKRALHAIKLIKKHFNKEELRQLLTANYYSILYYNAEVWLIPSLNQQLKKHLLSASSAALRLIESSWDDRVSFRDLHLRNKRATPMQMMTYKHSLQLHKLYNSNMQSNDWLDLNFQQNFNARQNHFQIIDTSRLKVGKNKLCNRLNLLNGKIELNWLLYTYEKFKLKCKSLYLSG